MPRLHLKKIKFSLKNSLFDGLAASVMAGFTSEYFTPFLLLLGGTAQHVALLTALPNFFSSLVQFISPDLTDRLRSRKKIVLIFVFLQALMLFPILVLALKGASHPGMFILFVMLFSAFGAMALPAWASLMSDLVPVNKRGVYFGWRNRICGFSAVSFTFLGGFIIHKMESLSAFIGFAILFGSAFLMRLLSWVFLSRMHEPHLEQKTEHYFSLVQFLSRLKQSNFAKFVLFAALINYTVFIVSPFFAVLMIKDLHFDYLTYTIVTVAATLATQFSFPRWGKYADKVGNLKVIKCTAPLIGLIPVFWILNQNPVFLVLAQIFSGFLWAGFNLCALNFIYDAVTPGKRTRCISYYNAFNGLAVCLGGLTGGLLLQWMPPFFGYKILGLMFISSLLRLLVALTFSGTITEVRPVEKINNNELILNVIGLSPLLNVIRKKTSSSQEPDVEA